MRAAQGVFTESDDGKKDEIPPGTDSDLAAREVSLQKWMSIYAVASLLVVWIIPLLGKFIFKPDDTATAWWTAVGITFLVAGLCQYAGRVSSAEGEYLLLVLVDSR